MRGAAFLVGTLTLFLAGQVRSDCGIKSEDMTGDSNERLLACQEPGFLRRLDFTVTNQDVTLDKDSSLCFSPSCCNKYLNLRRSEMLENHVIANISFHNSPDFDDKTSVGKPLQGKASFRCKSDGHKIISTEATCETFEIDGSGWNLLRAAANGMLCQPCEAGTKLSSDNSHCEPCDPGHYSSEGASHCHPCNAGFFAAEGASDHCDECPKGTFSHEAASTCENCHRGNFSDTSGASSCKRCPVGEFSSAEGATQCQRCPAGKFSNIEGATYCTPCPEGQFSDREGGSQCMPCFEGEYSNITGASQCQLCPTGHFSDIEGATRCKPCPEGKFSKTEGMSRCMPCDQGKYSDVTGASQCRLCPTGYFSEIEGATNCKPCPIGTFSDNEGESLCRPCEDGYYSMGGASICNVCPRNSNDEVIAAQCGGKCPRGTYRKSGGTKCLYCPAGHTTYSYNADVCVGPELYGKERTLKITMLTAKVRYDNIGSPVSLLWSSLGDWYLINRDNRKFARIFQKYTTSYRKWPRQLYKRGVTAVQPIIRNIYCYTDKGQSYRGYEHRTISGKKCANSAYCPIVNRKKVCYCRNRNTRGGHTRPYCRNSSGEEEDCDVPKCIEEEMQESEVVGCHYDRHFLKRPIGQYRSSVNFPDSKSAQIVCDKLGKDCKGAEIEFSRLQSARKICDKLGGDCKGVWGKGTSWRLTELSVSQANLGSGEFEYHEKSSDCTNPYHEYYFEQKWES